MMTAAEIRLKQNPILTTLLLGLGQGSYVAERLMPRLPQSLSSVTLAQMGDERFRRYSLRRAPGTATKRVNIRYQDKTYSVDQYSVEVPMPRELIREADEARRMNVNANLDISRIAMTTANDILGLDYELEVATLATTSGTYASGHVLALSGGTKWSAATGVPVTDITTASETIRKKIGKRPNTLTLSADAWVALRFNAQVKTFLPDSQQGPATTEQLKTILAVDEIVVGDAVWIDETDTGQDVWGNNAVLAYVPRIGGAGNGDISLAEPGFGFTNVLDGHPFAETPYYEAGLKSWIYGATYERRPNVAYNTAGFLFQNPK
ncbi:hypothetical protein [Thauera sp. 2A1]|uniref:hypothetical protein n=1 Tax=Thauera sp. 2A1 TaxID=2570191 RepID=UPI001291DA4C|nr:hypothetical protein [Thauera sp. 2A1]KAI5914614.1 hypothetical protein GH664_11755 [Thauera sp. 2A1]